MIEAAKKGLITLGKPVYRLLSMMIKIGFRLVKSLDQWTRLKSKEVKGPRIKWRWPELSFKRTERPKVKIQVKVNWSWKWNLLYGIGGMIMLLGAGGGTWFYYRIIKQLPDINQIYTPPIMSSKITDRNGVLLYKFYQEENRTWIPIKQIPESLIKATIAIEDKEFYQHHGVSWRGVLKAIWYNLKKEDGDKPRGGSTITQQLVKNVFLTNEKTWERKIKELMLAVLVESRLSKNEILERYFNQVPYGGDAYGAEEAAIRYFGKHVEELNLAESSFLAGLPAAPTSYSPYGESLKLALARQRHVVEEMLNAGFITKDEAEEIKKNGVAIKENKGMILAPHFVFYVRDELKKMGFSNFERQGLTIQTSLDLNIQRKAEEIVADEMSKVGRLKISNGAALILEVENGDILAMVGSKDYNATDIDGKYNVTTALRQPGSSIKPINYLLALENGQTLLSTIDDSPITYKIRGQKPYSPQNYNGKYMGRVTLKTALASSLNIPSVKLLDKNGVGEMVKLGREMGITTWEDANRFGLSLALGSGEVKMVDLAGAYSIFANMGDKVELNPIEEIRNFLGQKVYQKRIEPKKVIDPRYAFLINQALSDDQARAPIFGLNSKLKINGKTVAVKTGTTNSLRDNWCIGWTPKYLVVSWVGNNDNSPMSWVASGVSGATPIWNRIIHQMIDPLPDEKWMSPEGVNKAKVCGREEYFVNGTEAEVKCAPTGTLSPTPSP